MSTQVALLVDLYKRRDEYEREHLAARKQRSDVLRNINVQTFDSAMQAIDTAEQLVEEKKSRKIELNNKLDLRLYRYLVTDSGDPMALVTARFPNDLFKQNAFLEDLMRTVKLASAR